MTFSMSLELVSTTTAAFIAGLSDRQMQRVVDEDIVGAPLVSREGGRVFAPMTSALARFYFTTSEVFTREARRAIIQIIVNASSVGRTRMRCFPFAAT